jgi:hypothetical protein
MSTAAAVSIAAIWAFALYLSVARVSRAWERVALSRRPPESDAEALKDEEVPEDLMALAMQENEMWAQEELMRVIRERYEMYRDWNRVRSAMGLGQRADA